MGDLRWVAPTREDDDTWVELLAEIEAVDRRGESVTLDDLADEWASVWSHPATDAVLVWEGPVLVAFGWLKTVPGQRTEHRVECWGGVRPSHRARGIGTALLEWQVRRAREIAAGLDPALPTRIGLDAGDRQQALLALAGRAGFEPVRVFLEVTRAVVPPPAAAASPGGVELVAWSDDFDEAARLAHAEAFAEHWGTEPRTAEEWRQWYTGHRGFRPDVSRVALREGTDEVVGFVLAAAYPADWEHDVREAWIHTIGTRDAWRGRGIGRALLVDSLRAMGAADDRFDRAILGVDSRNEGALALYTSVGFERLREATSLGRAP